MIGAIVGDIVGSRFEFNNTNQKDFKLFTKECSFTDDTICTVAIAYALVNSDEINFEESLRSWCGIFNNPMGGYGGRFAEWIWSEHPQPYESFGNGSAMRVSPVAWWYDNLHDVLLAADASARPTHNHPEGMKGAEAVAHTIFALRTRQVSNYWKSILRDVGEHYYRGCFEASYRRGVFDETCMGTVPVAFQILYNSTSFEDAIRNAVAWGGDSDTLAAIVGSIAEAIWGIPDEIRRKAFEYLPEMINCNIGEFYQKLNAKKHE